MNRHAVSHAATPPPLSPSAGGRVVRRDPYDAGACSSLGTLTSFLAAPGHANGVDNRQTRMLGGALLEPRRPEPRPAAELFAAAREALATKVDLALVVEHFEVPSLWLHWPCGGV